MIKTLLFIIWPWYIVGPLLGITVPLLLLVGNKALGISSTLRHLCAIALPAKIPFLTYNWREHTWQLLFAFGLILGGTFGHWVLSADAPIPLLPAYEPKQWAVLLGGGFLVGFGTRWSGGCTSGHGIFGLGALQWASLTAVVSFFATGIITAWLLY